MTRDVAIASTLPLPSLVKEAAAALARATSAAEVLEARDKAALVYDAAKRAARLLKAKAAHDELVGATYRVQADALEIESQAKVRLADEYDAAQERGEVAGVGGGLGRLGKGKIRGVPTATDIGVKRKNIFEARQLRDAIAQRPRALRIALDDILQNGAEPTRALLMREIGAVRTRHRTAAPDVHRGAEHRLVDGQNLFRINHSEIDALIARFKFDVDLLVLVRDHVANPEPDDRVGNYLSKAALDELIRHLKGGSH